MRIEKDSLGELVVDETALYGIHTTRSLKNFYMAGEPLPLPIIYAMVQLKQACAEANRELGLLAADKAMAIIKAGEIVLTGKYNNQFPIDLFQAGSGTSSNMNVNEVLANLAAMELGGKPGDRTRVHPNDEVNKGQSTNNVFPSAIRIAALEKATLLNRAGQELVDALEAKKEAFREVLKSGRTHLQDAVPITLGQEFGAWAQAVRKSLRRIDSAMEMLKELGIGGNAIGTGINNPSEFRHKVIEMLNSRTGGDFRVAEHGIEITQFLTDMGWFSSALRMLSTDLLKIVNDLRLLSSGPNTGLGEIILPPVEPGSSIMPGKINPSICEAANMACMQVLGYDHATATACAAGQLELNTHMPLVGANLIKSCNILCRVCTELARQCIEGIIACPERCLQNFETSAGLATVLNPLLGYDRVAQLVKESLKTGKSIRHLAAEHHLLPPEELDALLVHSTGPFSPTSDS